MPPKEGAYATVLNFIMKKKKKKKALPATPANMTKQRGRRDHMAEVPHGTNGRWRKQASRCSGRAGGRADRRPSTQGGGARPDERSEMHIQVEKYEENRKGVQ